MAPKKAQDTFLIVNLLAMLRPFGDIGVPLILVVTLGQVLMGYLDMEYGIIWIPAPL